METRNSDDKELANAFTNTLNQIQDIGDLLPNKPERAFFETSEDVYKRAVDMTREEIIVQLGQILDELWELATAVNGLKRNESFLKATEEQRQELSSNDDG